MENKISSGLPFAMQSGKKALVALLVLVAGIVQAFGQAATVQGTVVDEQGLGLPGVNITIQGKMAGSVTDLDGHFIIQASPSDTLVFSFVGYAASLVAVRESHPDRHRPGTKPRPWMKSLLWDTVLRK
ncbi:MAG: carboxypeptidase-like regulatory domain-containing protein [Bacteroidales bacterium]